MKKYFVSFVIQEKGSEEKRFLSDMVDFKELNTIQVLRDLEEFLQEQWSGDENEEVTIMNFKEI